MDNIALAALCVGTIAPLLTIAAIIFVAGGIKQRLISVEKILTEGVVPELKRQAEKQAEHSAQLAVLEERCRARKDWIEELSERVARAEEA